MKIQILATLALAVSLGSISSPAQAIAMVKVGNHHSGVVIKETRGSGLSADEDSASDPHNCHGKVQKRGDGWGEKSPTVITPYKTWQKYTHQYIYSELIGLYCPNGKHPAKFFPTELSHCYTWITDPDENPPYWWFQNDRVNAYALEQAEGGGRNVNPPAFYIPDDGTRQNCKTQVLSSAKSGWLRIRKVPVWKQWNCIRLRHLNDVEFRMRGYHDRLYNKIIPSQMTKISGWKKP